MSLGGFKFILTFLLKGLASICLQCGELYSFEGNLYERRWAADNDAQRMADRVDAYVEIVANQ